MLIAIVILGIFLVFAGSLIVGRLGGLGITALYGATMAFFWMPPRFSLRVAQTHDLIALAFYGVAGLVLVRTTPAAKRRPEPSAGIASDLNPTKPLETSLSIAIADQMSSALGDRLRALDFSWTTEALTLPCTRAEASRIMSDALTEALKTPQVSGISICIGQRPGVRQVILAAHYHSPDESPAAITIGKADEDCNRIHFPDWPAHSALTWFDNGYDRIFQISVKSL